jgi:hypothetical protein
MVPRKGRMKMTEVHALDRFHRPFKEGARIYYVVRCGSAMDFRGAKVLEVWYEEDPQYRLRPEAKLKIEITLSSRPEEIGKVRTITNANVVVR